MVIDPLLDQLAFDTERRPPTLPMQLLPGRWWERRATAGWIARPGAFVQRPEGDQPEGRIPLSPGPSPMRDSDVQPPGSNRSAETATPLRRRQIARRGIEEGMFREVR